MSINTRTRLAVVLGWPVEHSKSPAMHNAGFVAAGIDAVYLALPVAPEDLNALISGLCTIPALGASVTVPHKTAIVEYCDALSPSAEAIGAVNTLEFRESGELIGHNTDAAGFVRAYRDATKLDMAGRRVVLLGAGGAARAVAFGVQDAGASEVQVIARRPETVTWATAQAWQDEVFEACLADCDLLVDCTSMGLEAASEAKAPARVPIEKLPERSVVSTLVYHRETALLAAARSRGLQTLDGSGMLLFQGALAFEIWTGVQAPIDAMRSALAN